MGPWVWLVVGTVTLSQQGQLVARMYLSSLSE